MYNNIGATHKFRCTVSELALKVNVNDCFNLHSRRTQSSAVRLRPPAPDPTPTMHATALVYIATLAVITTTFYNMIEARPLCESCNNRLECDEPPKEMCMFGEARNYCNRRVCARGPGDRCGGMYDQYGICGEGLRCTSSLHEMGVNRCHGCSLLTLDCY